MDGIVRRGDCQAQHPRAGHLPAAARYRSREQRARGSRAGGKHKAEGKHRARESTEPAEGRTGSREARGKQRAPRGSREPPGEAESPPGKQRAPRGSREPPGVSRSEPPGQGTAPRHQALRTRQRNIALRGPEVLPATGTGWTRPVSPGVRCLPYIRRPPPVRHAARRLPAPVLSRSLSATVLPSAFRRQAAFSR